MLVNRDEESRGVIAGLDLAVRVHHENTVDADNSTIEVIPHGDSTFCSIDLGEAS